MDPNYQNLRHIVPVSSFHCFLTRHSRHIQVVFNGSSPALSRSASFSLFSFLAPISSLEERIGCFHFMYVTQPSCLISFQVFLQFAHSSSLPSSFVILCFQVIPSIPLNQRLMMRSIQFCDCHGPCFISIFQGCLHKRLIQPDSDLYLFIEIK